MAKHIEPTSQAKFWEDLEPGDSLATTGITVSESHLVTWAGLTGDIVQFHLDEEYAKTTPFGARIGHGPLTLSLGLGLSTQTGYLGNVVAWLGLDQLKALKPVFIGDTLHAVITVGETRETSKPERGVWILNYAILNQHDEEVMTFVSSVMVSRRH